MAPVAWPSLGHAHVPARSWKIQYLRLGGMFLGKRFIRRLGFLRHELQDGYLSSKPYSEGEIVIGRLGRSYSLGPWVGPTSRAGAIRTEEHIQKKK